MSENFRATKPNRQLMLVHINSTVKRKSVDFRYVDMPDDTTPGYVAEMTFNIPDLDELLSILTNDGWWISAIGPALNNTEYRSAYYTIVFYRDLERYDV